MNKLPKIPIRRFCARCRVHGVRSEVRGHRKNCEYSECQCDKCQYQKYANEISLRERRMQKNCDDKMEESLNKVGMCDDDDEKSELLFEEELKLKPPALNEIESAFAMVYQNYEEEFEKEEKLPSFTDTWRNGFEF